MAKKQIATFLGTQPGLSIAGDYCYAYSGIISDASSGSAASTLLKFTTGKYTSVVDCYLFTDRMNGNALYLSVTMNGTIVYQGAWDNSPSKVEGGGPLVAFVIPWNTSFEIKWGASGGTYNATCALTGRVYR